jgi:hypothetical protein
MIKILIPVLFISLSSQAEECATPHPLNGQPVVELMDYKCLSDDLKKEEVTSEIYTEKKTKKFCKKCHNPFSQLKIESEEYKQQRRKELSEAVFAELEKELSFITIDLMKIRSSFSLPIDPKDAINNCQFEKLQSPKCLPSNDKFLKSLKTKSQNAIATELANILSEDQIKGESLLKRPLVNECSPKLKENHVISAQMRYHESLLTKDLLEELKNIDFSNSKNLDQAIEELSRSDKLKNKNIIGKTRSILTHPLVKALITRPDEFRKFVDSIPNDAENKKIVEMLNSSGPAIQFSKTISDRCLMAMTQAAEILEKVYCSPETPYFADNAKVMGIINKKNFSDLSDEEAERKLQNFCLEYNNQSQKTGALNFNEILKINKNNDSSLVSLPQETFKTDAYDRSIGYDANAICKASKDSKHCSQDKELRECQMLANFELLKTDKTYQRLADTSDRNINEILRSLIGEGLPQNGSGVDSYAVDLLKKEGILPGQTQTNNSQPRDVVSFQKEIQNLPAAKGIKAPSQQLAYEKSSHKINQTNDSANTPLNQEGSSNNKNENQNTQKVNSNFSSLSEEEQKKILNYLKNKPSKTPTAVSGPVQNSNPSGIQKPTQHLNPEDEVKGTQVSTQTLVNPEMNGVIPKISSRENSQLSAPDKKSISESYNKALQEAQLRRSPASGNQLMVPSLSLSKNADGVNEIEIEVNEDDLGRVVIFKEKLKELLKSHSEEIIKLKEGEKLIIMINNHEILLTYNSETRNYEAKSNDKSLPVDYLNTISHYFNVTLKEGPGKREALLKTFKVSQNHKMEDPIKATGPSK